MFLSFVSVGVQNMRGRKRTGVVIDGRRTSMTGLCFSFSLFFLIYTPVFTVSLASEKRGMCCVLSTWLPFGPVFF